MNLPLGTRVKDKCKGCKKDITGIVTKKGKASFHCPECKLNWELGLVESKGKGSRFTEESLKQLMERNKHIRERK